jgi:hypothetical protein
MTARLLRPDGSVYREWRTDRPDLALTANRNFPPGWRVEIEAKEVKTDQRRLT